MVQLALLLLVLVAFVAGHFGAAELLVVNVQLTRQLRRLGAVIIDRGLTFIFLLSERDE